MDTANIIYVDFIKPTRLTGDQKVLLRDIWKQLRVQKHFADWANQNLAIFNENEDFGSFHLKVKRETGGTTLKEYWVTINTAKELCMLSRTEEGKKVRQYFIECERLVYEHGLNHKLTAIPDVLDSDFLQALADRVRVIEQERDEAIRTKAQISDRKTATAMNTASHAVKARNHALRLVTERDGTIENLAQRLGESEEWATAAVAIVRHPELAKIGENMLGRKLAKRSRELGIEVKKLTSDRYPAGIGIYHATVIEAFLKSLD
jgi:phage anti-repressor protein